MKPHVALVMPRRKEMRRDEMIGATIHASPQGKCQVYPFAVHSSLLNHSFNQCLAWAVNQYEAGISLTHLAIVHDDIQSDPAWIDTHVATMDERDADFVSSAVPIKDDRGCSSTAVYENDIWDYRRFTMRELGMMPEVFSHDEYAGNLILNTGCCVLKLRDPWLSHPDQFVFQDQQRLERNEKGQWQAKVVSEDWLFTDAIRQAGGRLVLSRKVGILHEGTRTFPSSTNWGLWQTDEYYAQRHGAKHEDSISTGLQVPTERCVAVA